MGAGSLLVLGLGNLLCGDDGLGVAVVDELARRYRPGPGVRLLDGGTLGLALLAHLRDCEDLILVDAVLSDAPAGSRVRLSGDEVAPAARERLSVHQVGVADLLDGLRLLGTYPRRLVLLGLVPRNLELGLGLSPPVAAGVEELTREVVREVEAMGYALSPRPYHEASELSRSAAVAGLVGL
jgi:hydrogenase maturation protease